MTFFKAEQVYAASRTILTKTNNIDEFNRITGWVAKHNGQIINLRTVETSLEDIFLKLMN